MIQEIINKYESFIKSKGWTHARAAEEIGCCRAHMSRIFNGQRMPSITLLNKMENKMKEYDFKE